MRIPRATWPLTEKVWTKLVQIVNGQIGFGSPSVGADNLDLVWLSTTTPAVADTEFTLTHNLGRVPSGYTIMSIDKAGIVYKGTTAWTTTQLSLKCNQASAAAVIIVV